jgi:DUF305 family protein family protein
MEQKIRVGHKMKGQAMQSGHYGRLLAMLVLSFLAMFGLMYAMVNTFDNVFANLNQFYMAGLMVAPMAIIELALMWNMYPNRKLNSLILSVSVVALIVFWVCIRQQTGISDREFIKSMIPHHGGAVLMCEQNKLRDPELQQLCRDIISSQQAEIDFMEKKLAE